MLPLPESGLCFCNCPLKACIFTNIASAVLYLEDRILASDCQGKQLTQSPVPLLLPCVPGTMLPHPVKFSRAASYFLIFALDSRCCLYSSCINTVLFSQKSFLNLCF